MSYLFLLLKLCQGRNPDKAFLKVASCLFFSASLWPFLKGQCALGEAPGVEVRDTFLSHRWVCWNGLAGTLFSNSANVFMAEDSVGFNHMDSMLKSGLPAQCCP